MVSLRHILCCICFLVIASSQVRGQCSLQLEVTDAQHQPLPGAEIRVGEQAAITDSAGMALLQGLACGLLNVTVNKPGWRTVHFQWRETGNGTHRIKLQPGILELGQVEVRDSLDGLSGGRMNDVEGVYLYATKKTEQILVDRLLINRSTPSPRQVFSRISGFNVVENDGAGMQYGVGGRGLHPSRMANFNVRQNGYEISADALGYPENYYLPPIEAVEEIQVLRGASSLQYGPQFGGLINFRFYQPAITPARRYTLAVTGGMYGYFGAFGDLHYARKKWGLYSFYQFRMHGGWRPHSGISQHTAHLHLRYAPSARFEVSAEYTFSHSLGQQPGGLTDGQFQQDPAQSFRSRNWMGIQWHLFQMRFTWKPNSTAQLECMPFGLLGTRGAVGFWGPMNQSDPGTRRDLLNDRYRNIGVELRYLQRFTVLQRTQVFLAGARFYHGHTTRIQGTADSLSDANFNLLLPGEPDQASYTFPGYNASLFSEMIWQFTPALRLVPGVRLEYIRTDANGYFHEVYRDLAGNIIFQQKNDVQRSNERWFILAGMGLSYRKGEHEVYGNFSRNYRSVTFSDIQVLNPNYRVDPELRDEKGYTADLGYRWQKKGVWYLDAGLFYIYYADRIGTLLKTDTITYTLYRYRTNLAASHSFGVDLVAETNILGWFSRMQASRYKLLWMLSANYTWARYDDPANLAIHTKTVEYTPAVLLRTSLTLQHPRWGAGLTASYTAEQYSDATNALQSNNGNYGTIPASFLLDLNLSYRLHFMEAGLQVRNLTNSSYFTQRSEGYSGPGIIPGAPLSIQLGLTFRL